MLAQHGFTIVTVTKGAGTAGPDFTFSALAADTPRSRLTVISCDDPSDTALAMTRAIGSFATCGGSAASSNRAIRKAWNLLDEMTASPALIATLELPPRCTSHYHHRVRAEKLAYLDSDALPSNVQVSLNLRWPHLCEMLIEIYKMLCSRNPVARKSWSAYPIDGPVDRDDALGFGRAGASARPHL